MVEWSNRLEQMQQELVRIERQVSTTDIEVKTYPEETVVTLRYTHDGENDDPQYGVTDD